MQVGQSLGRVAWVAALFFDDGDDDDQRRECVANVAAVACS
jgi:hypothetical protein